MGFRAHVHAALLNSGSGLSQSIPGGSCIVKAASPYTEYLRTPPKAVESPVVKERLMDH
jgi:hypothetical protein